MGAPTKEVTALIGSVCAEPGSWLMASQINKTIAPISAEAGNKIR